MSTLTTLKVDKTGAKTGIFTDNDGVEHTVVARRQAERYSVQYHLTIDGVSDGPVIEKRGTGRNLTWNFNGGSYGGTLQDAVHRAVGNHLANLRHAVEVTATVDRINAVLPYEFAEEQKAIDFAFTSQSLANGVIGKYSGKFYVGFYTADEVDAVVLPLGDVKYLDIRVYGAIDPRKVISRLRDLGISATLDRDYTSAQVYIDNGNGALLLDKETGNLEVVHWDRSGGVVSDQHVGQATDVNSAVEAIHRWYASYDLQQRAQSLLEHLQTEVPSGVAHYAVEQAKAALRTLSREAHSVDFTYGRDYTGVSV